MMNDVGIESILKTWEGLIQKGYSVTLAESDCRDIGEVVTRMKTAEKKLEDAYVTAWGHLYNSQVLYARLASAIELGERTERKRAQHRSQGYYQSIA